MAGKNKIMQAVVSFAGTIDPSLGKAMDNVAGHLDKVNWKAVAVGAAVGGIAVATGKAVVEAGKYLAELGDDYNKAMNQLSASTGATGDELDALGESVKNIYAQNLGEDFNDVAEGLAATQKASDLAGEALEQATAAGFVLRDTFDYDISESARAASALMKNFNISAEEAYGLIATGAQNGADKNGDLLDTLNEYSAQFAAIGLSADQFMGSLVEGADAGLFSIDKVADAVKEFNIRAKDGSDSSAEAFKGLGLNSDKMFAAFAAGGETAQAAFFDTVEALNKLEDPLKRNEIGVALFGSQFEDLEAGILPVLGDIETAAYDGAAALQQSFAGDDRLSGEGRICVRIGRLDLLGRRDDAMAARWFETDQELGRVRSDRGCARRQWRRLSCAGFRRTRRAAVERRRARHDHRSDA